MKLVVLLEIVAPSEEEKESEYVLPKDVRDSIYNLYKEGLDWEEVFAPIKDIELRYKYIDLFNKIDELERNEV